MRMSREEKNESHKRILTSASRIVRERGLEGASVGAVMEDAGLTHGGFYKHFESKEALIEAALAEAFAEIARVLEDGEPDRAVAAYRALYLSTDHKDNPGHGCPIAALGPEVAREPAHIKAAFGRGVRRIVAGLGRDKTGTAHVKAVAALRELSMLVGAIVIARASDEQTARDVLAACRKAP